MNSIQNLVVVGAKNTNQAKLETVLPPVKSETEMQMAVTSIFHAHVCNITEQNNTINIRYISKSGIVDEEVVIIKLSPNLFKNSYEVLKKIRDEIKLHYKHLENSPQFEVSMIKEKISINMVHIEILECDNSPWNILGMSNMIPDRVMRNVWKVDNKNLEELVSRPAFIYASIVENSYINNNLSRLLTIIPLGDRRGWNFHEFQNPNYIPIAVREFSKIAIEIFDIDGNHVKFDPNYETIIVLNIKPINTTKQLH